MQAEAVEKGAQGGGRLWSYENRLLATLSVAESSMFLDRLALGILTPFIVAELHLSNFEIGLLASVFSVSYAVAGYVGGWIADRTGQRRMLLMMHVVAFSLLSAITGFAWSFAFLLTARFVLGLAEGPVLPLLQSIMVPASSPGRMAFNAAFLMNVAPSIIGQFAAPIVLTHLAALIDWRATFFMTALPGLIILPFIYFLVPGGSSRQADLPADAGGAEEAARPDSLFRNRNVMLCVAMAACTGTWIYMMNTFLPLYLVRSAGYTAVDMGYATSMLGIGGCAASLVLPALSDKVGRKPILLVAFLLGAAAPLAALLVPDSRTLLVAGVLIGSCMLGITPLTITIIPADAVRRDALARAVGLTSASSAIIGGMVMTAVAGKAADMFGLTAPFVIALGALVLAIALSTALRLPRPDAAARD